MKCKLFTVACGALLLTACSGNVNNDHQAHNIDTGKKDMSAHLSPAADAEIKVVSVTFNKVDAKAAAAIGEMVGHYLHIKNALANDNGKEAANGAKAMEKAISKLDKSLLTAEQKTAYDRNEVELNEHTDHIAKNGDKIEHQRSHFALLSEVVYSLVKDFGAGRTLYHDHCPMAKENQGAMWISEMKEVKNPYFGASMLTCGTVEEVIN